MGPSKEDEGAAEWAEWAGLGGVGQIRALFQKRDRLYTITLDIESIRRCHFL